jgi:hypothetical protein
LSCRRCTGSSTTSGCRHLATAVTWHGPGATSQASAAMASYAATMRDRPTVMSCRLRRMRTSETPFKTWNSTARSPAHPDGWDCS